MNRVGDSGSEFDRHADGGRSDDVSRRVGDRLRGMDRSAGADRPSGPSRPWRELGEVQPVGSMPDLPSLGPTVPVWPNLLFRELLAVLACLLVLLVVSLLFNAPLEAPADPATTPNPAKAPWYFVGLQELLVYFDPWIAGVAIPLVIVFGLAAIPYLDPSRKGEGVYTFRERPVAVGIFTFGLVGWFVLILVGLVFRGPGWAWVWPWTHGPVHPATEASGSLPNVVGVPLLLAYFVGGGYLLLRWIREWVGLGALARVTFVFLALAFAGVVLKIVLHLAFGLRYFVSFPGSGFSV
ncbi:MAG: hypothetical protein H6682_13355 [Candidatus Eisenbacteria bacterium]|nr:hypothetical protein [Candidatus Eisenbacteria bacterium]